MIAFGFLILIDMRYKLQGAASMSWKQSSLRHTAVTPNHDDYQASCW